MLWWNVDYARSSRCHASAATLQLHMHEYYGAVLCHAVPIVQYDKSFFFFVLESSSAAVAATRQAGALGSGDCTTEYCQ